MGCSTSKGQTLSAEAAPSSSKEWAKTRRAEAGDGKHLHSPKEWENKQRKGDFDAHDDGDASTVELSPFGSGGQTDIDIPTPQLQQRAKREQGPAPISTSPPRHPTEPLVARRGIGRPGRPALSLQLTGSQLSLKAVGKSAPARYGPTAVADAAAVAAALPGVAAAQPCGAAATYSSAESGIPAIPMAAGISRSTSAQIRQSNYVAAVETRLLRLGSLGRGSSGSVFKAVDLNTLQLVALKEIHVGDNPKHKAQALEEMSAFATQRMPLLSAHFSAAAGEERCPQILSYYGSSYDDVAQTISIAVEYEGGGSLAEWCAEELPAPEPWLAHVAHSVLLALAFIHERGRIHRDIKPGNLLIGQGGSGLRSGYAPNGDSLGGNAGGCGNGDGAGGGGAGGGGAVPAIGGSWRPAASRAMPVMLEPVGTAMPPAPPAPAAVPKSAALKPAAAATKLMGAPAGAGRTGAIRRQRSGGLYAGVSALPASRSHSSPPTSPLRLPARPRSSILIRKAETLPVMLADFGIAKNLQEASANGSVNLTFRGRAPQSPTGTRRFMAPERLRLEKYHYNTDIWSLGLTLATVFNRGRCPIPHAANEFEQLCHAEELEDVILNLARRGDPGGGPSGGGRRNGGDRGGDGDAAAGIGGKWASAAGASSRRGSGTRASNGGGNSASGADFLETPSEEFRDFLWRCLRANPEERPDASTLLGHAFLTRRVGWELRCPDVLNAADVRRRRRASKTDPEDLVRRIVRARFDDHNYAPAVDCGGVGGGTAIGIAELAYDLDMTERDLKHLFQKVTDEMAVTLYTSGPGGGGAGGVGARRTTWPAGASGGGGGGGVVAPIAGGCGDGGSKTKVALATIFQPVDPAFGPGDGVGIGVCAGGTAGCASHGNSGGGDDPSVGLMLSPALSSHECFDPTFSPLDSPIAEGTSEGSHSMTWAADADFDGFQPAVAAASAAGLKDGRNTKRNLNWVS